MSVDLLTQIEGVVGQRIEELAGGLGELFPQQQRALYAKRDLIVDDLKALLCPDAKAAAVPITTVAQLAAFKVVNLQELVSGVKSWWLTQQQKDEAQAEINVTSENGPESQAYLAKVLAAMPPGG